MQHHPTIHTQINQLVSDLTADEKSWRLASYIGTPRYILRRYFPDSITYINTTSEVFDAVIEVIQFDAKFGLSPKYREKIRTKIRELFQTKRREASNEKRLH